MSSLSKYPLISNLVDTDLYKYACVLRAFLCVILNPTLFKFKLLSNTSTGTAAYNKKAFNQVYILRRDGLSKYTEETISKIYGETGIT